MGAVCWCEASDRPFFLFLQLINPPETGGEEAAWAEVQIQQEPAGEEAAASGEPTLEAAAVKVEPGLETAAAEGVDEEMADAAEAAAEEEATQPGQQEAAPPLAQEPRPAARTRELIGRVLSLPVKSLLSVQQAGRDVV